MTDELLAWLRDVAAERATAHDPVPGGDAFRHDAFPAAYDHNLLLIQRAASAAAVAEAADAVLGGAGLEHRLVEGHPALAGTLDGLVALGYERGTDQLMTFAGAVPRGSDRVEELDLAERARVARESWEESSPWMAPDVRRQLGDRVETVSGACEPTFLAIRAPDGRVLARLDLYRRDDVVQLEELVTVPAARNRGLATALIGEGVRRAAGARVTFLVADAGSRPAAMYRRLGFQDAGTKITYTRHPPD